MDSVYVLHIVYGDDSDYRQSVHASEAGAEGELIEVASEYYENVMDEPLPEDRDAALRAIDSRVPFDWTIEEYVVQP